MATQSKVNLIGYIINKMNNNIDLTTIVDESKTSDDLSVDNIKTAKYYRIKETGNTDFTLIGATDSNIGTVFLSPNIRNGNPIVDSTGIVNEVDPVYGSKPFVPNVFKLFDNGMIRELLDIKNIPLEELPDAKRYIIVEITNAGLEKETIYSVTGNQPDEISLESWIGSVGVELLIWCEDNQIYNQVYDAMLDMHNTEFRDIIELNSTIINDGITRSLDMKSRVFKDGEQLININGDNFKEMFFPININIANKGILRSSRYRLQYRTSAVGVEPEIWEEIPLGVSAKDFKYTKLHQDDTNSGEAMRKSVADVADREIAFNVVWDIDKQFIQSLETEMEKSRFDDNIYTYTFKKIKEYAGLIITDDIFPINLTLNNRYEYRNRYYIATNTTIVDNETEFLNNTSRYDSEYKMSLVSAVENNTSAYNVVLVTFIEVE